MRLTSGFAKFAVVLLAVGFSAGLVGCGKVDKGTGPKTEMGKSESSSTQAIGGGSEVPMKADEVTTSEPVSGEPTAVTEAAKTEDKPAPLPDKTEDNPAADAPKTEDKPAAPAKAEDKPADAPQAEDKK